MPDCPRRSVPSDIADALSVLQMADDNILPVAGGSLDQADGFAAARSKYHTILHRLKIPRG